MSKILHITTRQAWRESQVTGWYQASSLQSQGFIHCSKPDHVVAVANFLFKHQADLVLLCIDSDEVNAEIRYENLDGGTTLFPHVYGPINIDAVKQTVPFEPNSDGQFELRAVIGNW